MNNYKNLRECKKLHRSNKTCVKKCEVTSQVPACAFNQTEEEQKYYQYYNDGTKNTTIDLVNDDCLAEIFMWLSAYERPKVALVCKKWERALDYSWQNVKKLKLTHWENNECPTWSYKYPTIGERLSFWRSVLHKCGHYLTELDLTAYGNCNIVPVINESCLKLVKLHLRFQYIKHEFLDNAFSCLSKLKVLKIIFQNICYNGYIPITFIKSLKNVAGTLTELTLFNWHDDILYNRCRLPKRFVRVISKLKALKSIETAGVKLDTVVYEYLINHKISVFSYDHNHFNLPISITNSFKNITFLNFISYRPTDDCLYTVANCLKKLKKLSANCERVTDAGIIAVSKLNQLKYLAFYELNNVTDSSVLLLKNLVTLNLELSNKIADNTPIKILENSPEMEVLCLKELAVNSEFLEKAVEIATNRKKKLEVDLLNIPGIKQYASQYLHLVLYDSSKKKVYDSEEIIESDNEF